MNNSEIIERMKSVAKVREDQELAKIFGVTKSAVANWKRGTAISLVAAFEFAQKYNVSLDWLITGNEKVVLDEMETELLTRFKRLDFSQKLQVFNQLGGGQTNGVTQTSGDHGINVGGNVAIGK